MQTAVLLYLTATIMLMAAASAGISYDHNYKGCMATQNSHVACDKIARRG